MRRFHVHLSVLDIEESVRFYSTMFGERPVIEKSDYAKWMLEDPRINFAISKRGASVGINHLGLQFDNDEERASHEARMKAESTPMREEKAAACCYSEADKHWVNDPQGIPWEAFHTLKQIPVFGIDSGPETPAMQRKVFKIHTAPVQCCAPAATDGKPTATTT